MKEILNHLSDQFLELESCDVLELLPDIQKRMENCDNTREWERSVVSFFLINALRFKDNTKRNCQTQAQVQERPKLRVIK